MTGRKDPVTTLEAVADCLWPDGDPHYEWTADTLDEVADVMTRAGWRPDDRCSHWRTCHHATCKALREEAAS